MAGDDPEGDCPETDPAIVARFPGRHLMGKSTDRPLPSKKVNP